MPEKRCFRSAYSQLVLNTSLLGTVLPSETPIVRPKGQYRDATGSIVYGPTQRLDYELEVAAVIGKASVLGEPVKIEEADEYIFGLVLLNDWSGEFSNRSIVGYSLGEDG